MLPNSFEATKRVTSQKHDAKTDWITHTMSRLYQFVYYFPAIFVGICFVSIPAYRVIWLLTDSSVLYFTMAISVVFSYHILSRKRLVYQDSLGWLAHWDSFRLSATDKSGTEKELFTHCIFISKNNLLQLFKLKTLFSVEMFTSSKWCSFSQ